MNMHYTVQMDVTIEQHHMATRISTIFSRFEMTKVPQSIHQCPFPEAVIPRFPWVWLPKDGAEC